MSSNKEYKSIFKTTFLFGFVQIFNILVKVGTNKAVALLLGAEGMGIIGLYNSAVGMLKTGAGLGISQSAVRDISQANGANDSQRFSKTISVTNRIIIFTSLFGVILTIALSPTLSKFGFGNYEYIVSYIWLSVVVGVNILSEGQLAILKGMRQLRALAKASMMGSLSGLLSAVPFYYFFRDGGIIPSIMITAFASLFFSNYYVRKIKYERVSIPLKFVFKEASPMIMMGIALMFTSFLANLSTLIISSFIRSKGGLEDVGLYNAGATIIHGYFGIIATALTTDYYPRISAINHDNKAVEEELNKQSIVSLILCCPIIVLFIFLLPIFIVVLYSKEFLPTIDYISFAIFNTLIVICSNQVDMILVAKFKIKVFIVISVFFRIFGVAISVVLYKYYGLLGMGVAQAIIGGVHMLVMTISVYLLYRIKYHKFFYNIGFIVLTFTILSLLVGNLNNMALKYSIGSFLFVLSLVFSLLTSKKYLNTNIITLFKKH